MLLTSFSKHSALIPGGQSVGRDRGGGIEYFREGKTAHVHNLVPTEIVCCLSLRKYLTSPVKEDTLCPRGLARNVLKHL